MKVCINVLFATLAFAEQADALKTVRTKQPLEVVVHHKKPNVQHTQQKQVVHHVKHKQLHVKHTDTVVLHTRQKKHSETTIPSEVVKDPAAPSSSFMVHGAGTQSSSSLSGPSPWRPQFLDSWYGVKRYGPSQCVSLWKNEDGHCIMSTSCTKGEIKDYEFGFICVNKVYPVKQLFGKGSFAPEETFDTLIKCDQCLGLENVPDDIRLAGDVASASEQMDELVSMSKNITESVSKLQHRVFPASPAPSPSPAGGPVQAPEAIPKAMHLIAGASPAAEAPPPPPAPEGKKEAANCPCQNGECPPPMGDLMKDWAGKCNKNEMFTHPLPEGWQKYVPISLSQRATHHLRQRKCDSEHDKGCVSQESEAAMVAACCEEIVMAHAAGVLHQHAHQYQRFAGGIVESDSE